MLKNWGFRMDKQKRSNWTNIFFLLFFFGTIAFIILAPIYIVNKIDKESKIPHHQLKMKNEK